MNTPKSVFSEVEWCNHNQPKASCEICDCEKSFQEGYTLGKQEADAELVEEVSDLVDHLIDHANDGMKCPQCNLRIKDALAILHKYEGRK